MWNLRTSRPLFQGRKHINLYLIPYSIPENSDGSISVTSWPAFYTLLQLQNLKSLGFDSVRLSFRGDLLVNSQYSNQVDLFNTQVSGLISFGKLCIQAGLLVNFDFHPTEYIASLIYATNDTTTPYFAAYQSSIVGLAKAIGANFSPGQVALDIFNEPNPPTAYWANSLQPVVFSSIRNVAPLLTLIVKGEGDTITNLENLNVSNYDWNTLYSVHNYDWADFTYAASPQLGEPYSYYSNVDYPPDGLSPATAISATTANINADPTLTSAQKTSYISYATSRLTNYYLYFTKFNLLNNDLPTITSWADKNGVDHSQIYIGEMGASQSGSSSSTTDTARANWYADVCGWYTSKNIRWGVYCADIPYFINPAATGNFYIQSPSAGAPSVCNSSNVPAVIKTALGLT